MKSLVVKRDSHFELLRIVSMFMIILHHFFCYGRYNFTLPFSGNDIVLVIFQSGGKIGVVLFILITGYYMVKEKNIRIRKLIEMEFQILYYSIGLFLILVLFFHQRYSMEEMIKIFFPNIFRVYWFVSGYFFLYLLIPYVNRLISNISKNEFRMLLLIGFVFLIFIPSIIIYLEAINETVYLFYYYMVGAYIRLYLDNIGGKYRYLFGFLLFYCFIVVITFYLIYLSFSNSLLNGCLYSFTCLKSIFVFGCGINLFLFFKNIKIKCNKIINYLASFSFGVYLFHEHIYMKRLLWNNFFPLSEVLNYRNLFINGLCIAAIIYVIGCLFDLIRRIIFGGIKHFFLIDLN